ncbi:Chondroitin sulfate proteoglycan 5 [Manis javanica]|nr:chondroitin sulfate proteoglycan 5 [Manis javanica]KAI5937378.1 Chondroitin sulfate proteoglycan 5 [Manis javanica]
MGRAGAGDSGRGPPPALLLLGAALVLAAGAAPAPGAGEAVRSVAAREPRANSTRTEAGRAAGEAEASRASQGGEQRAVVGPAARPDADGPGTGAGAAEAGSGDPQALAATRPAPVEAPGPSAVPPAASAPPEPRPAPEVLALDYLEGLDGGGLPGPPEAAEPLPDAGAEAPSWSLLDLYDDFTPFDESDFYPTTSFYDDLEEEGGDAGRHVAGGGGPDGHGDPGEPAGRWRPVPPQRPAEPAAGENGTECRSGFVRHNGSCRSLCDLFPSYCHNGGQCYLVEHVGAFCRCNTQDYIWHKGMRCESIITDFQVMCVAVGSAALVLLLLFMMTVFFAKKLYLLRTENTKLRRANKFRTPSEPHNDDFSLSTIAEGSHPNDDPSALHKVQETLKSCLKEEESYNIQNSVPPKLEGGKGDQADLEVNCLQNDFT